VLVQTIESKNDPKFVFYDNNDNAPLCVRVSSPFQAVPWVFSDIDVNSEDNNLRYIKDGRWQGLGKQ